MELDMNSQKGKALVSIMSAYNGSMQVQHDLHHTLFKNISDEIRDPEKIAIATNYFYNKESADECKKALWNLDRVDMNEINPAETHKILRDYHTKTLSLSNSHLEKAEPAFLNYSKDLSDRIQAVDKRIKEGLKLDACKITVTAFLIDQISLGNEKATNSVLSMNKADLVDHINDLAVKGGFRELYGDKVKNGSIDSIEPKLKSSALSSIEHVFSQNLLGSSNLIGSGDSSPGNTLKKGVSEMFLSVQSEPLDAIRKDFSDRFDKASSAQNNLKAKAGVAGFMKRIASLGKSKNPSKSPSELLVSDGQAIVESSSNKIETLATDETRNFYKSVIGDRLDVKLFKDFELRKAAIERNLIKPIIGHDKETLSQLNSVSPSMASAIPSLAHMSMISSVYRMKSEERLQEKSKELSAKTSGKPVLRVVQNTNSGFER